MLTLPSHLYAEWRVHAGIVPSLHDDPTRFTPREELLQRIWWHQRIQRNHLKTLDGKSLRVLHPGFWNREAGPDFRGAVLQWDRGEPLSGDVEIDLQCSGWRSHRHQWNRDYRNVILHVVWEADETQKFSLPTFALKPALDAPLSELQFWLSGEAAQVLPESLWGRCSSPLRQLPPELTRSLLRQAAQVRLEAKAAWFQARARHAGWEQALWEGVFRALGYKNNHWPMQHLAEQRHRWLAGISSSRSPVADLQSRLFGIGGLLPVDLSRRRSADDYLRVLWDLWWREREQFNDCLIPKSLWRLHGLRPANHPQRRLALAAHWLCQSDWPARLESWFTQTIPDAALGRTLTEVVQVQGDDFWNWHWTLRSPRLRTPQPLVGAQRVTDLAINVFLPWFWIRAVTGKNESLRRTAEHRYFVWPAGEDNAVLRLARQRLLGSTQTRLLNSAAAQQGLLQIVRDFCDHSNAVCQDCRFPKLVGELPLQ